jgi:hypothetical protein
MYFFNIVRHQFIFRFNTKRPTSSFFCEVFHKKFESLSEVWLFWSPSHWNACAHFKLEHWYNIVTSLLDSPPHIRLRCCGAKLLLESHLKPCRLANGVLCVLWSHWESKTKQMFGANLRRPKGLLQTKCHHCSHRVKGKGASTACQG